MLQYPNMWLACNQISFAARGYDLEASARNETFKHHYLFFCNWFLAEVWAQFHAIENHTYLNTTDGCNDMNSQRIVRRFIIIKQITLNNRSRATCLLIYDDILNPICHNMLSLPGLADKKLKCQTSSKLLTFTYHSYCLKQPNTHFQWEDFFHCHSTQCSN